MNLKKGIMKMDKRYTEEEVREILRNSIVPFNQRQKIEIVEMFANQKKQERKNG